jgi:hypothetical protein
MATVIQSLADAVTRMEGYFPGTRAYRNKNPGNIRGGSIYPQYPVDDQGFTVFPTAEAGRAALERDMQAKVNQGLTLQSLVYKYAPPTDNNDSAQYVANMATWTGLPVDVPLNQLGSQASVSNPLPEDTGDGFLASLFRPFQGMSYPTGGATDASVTAPEDSTMLWVGAGVLGIVLLVWVMQD